LKQIDFPAAIHLTSDELEARDLTFSLSVGPGLSDCSSNSRFIPRDTAGERGDKTSAGALDPWGKSRLNLAPDHQVEFGDEFACLDQGWYASFDRRDQAAYRSDVGYVGERRAAQVTAVCTYLFPYRRRRNAALNSSLGHPVVFFEAAHGIPPARRLGGGATSSVSARKTNNQRKQNQDQLKHDVLIQRHLSAQVPAEVQRRPKIKRCRLCLVPPLS
jgi:hypothetical protein